MNQTTIAERIRAQANLASERAAKRMAQGRNGQATREAMLAAKLANLLNGVL